MYIYICIYTYNHYIASLYIDHYPCICTYIYKYTSSIISYIIYINIHNDPYKTIQSSTYHIQTSDYILWIMDDTQLTIHTDF